MRVGLGESAGMLAAGGRMIYPWRFGLNKEIGVRIALLVAMMFCIGCAGVSKPSARVNQAVVAEQTAEGARLELVLVLDNPNDVPLPIRETRYRVEIDGVADGFEFTDKTAATMPAGDTQTLTLPSAFAGDLSDRAYQVSGAVVYETPGEFRRLLTDSGVPLPSVSFSARGNLE